MCVKFVSSPNVIMSNIGAQTAEALSLLKGSCGKKYKLGLKVVVFIDEFNGRSHFGQLGSCWPGEPKMSRKLVHSFGHLAENLVFRHLALIEKLCLWSPRAERKKCLKVRQKLGTRKNLKI